MHTSKAGVEFIKQWEGLRLEAYFCSGEALTIGYGHTGSDVFVGQVITKQEAEDLLKKDLVKYEDAVKKYINIGLNQNQFDALVSFTYNCGRFALRGSTLRFRLNRKDDPFLVAKEELIKWNKAAGNVVQGLVKRREAEIKLFCKEEQILELCTNYNTWLKKEKKPSKKLKSDQKSKVLKNRCYKGCKILKSENNHSLIQFPFNLGKWWVYNPHWDGLAENKEHSKSRLGYSVLNVPYQSQRDNYTQWWRTCFSSSCAMALMYLKPGAIKNDNEYLSEVLKKGNTIFAQTQIEVLNSYGLDAEFKTTGTLSRLKALISSGVPVPIGILHKGPSYAPQGSGHWVCCIGYNEDNKSPGGGYFICHDPYGFLEDGFGHYETKVGNAVAYSFNMLERRWTCEGSNSGWYVDLSNN